MPNIEFAAGNPIELSVAWDNNLDKYLLDLHSSSIYSTAGTISR